MYLICRYLKPFSISSVVITRNTAQIRHASYDGKVLELNLRGIRLLKLNLNSCRTAEH